MAAIWGKRSSDPIARNPKDVDRPQEAMQLAEVSRARYLPVTAADASLPSGQSWEHAHHARPAPSPTELLTSIRRFKWTIVLVSITVSTPIIAAIWTQITPKYQARAEIRVRPIIPRLVFKTDENGQIPFYESFVNTQAAIIRSPTILQRVLDQGDIQETAWYQNPPQSLVQRLGGGPPPAPLERLRENLSVRPRPRTEIIDVSFSDVSAESARLIVDAVLSEYMKYVNDVADEESLELNRTLQEEKATLENRIKGREAFIAEQHQKLGTELPQELVSSKRLRLDEMQARLNDLHGRIAILEWEKSQMAAEDSSDVSVHAAADPNKPPRYYADPEWRKLDFDVRRLQHQMAISRYAPNHPERARLAKDIEFAQELLRLRQAQLDEQWLDQSRTVPGAITSAIDASLPGERGLPTTEYLLARAKQEEQLLRTEMQKQQDEFDELFKIVQVLEEENSALRHMRELFEAVRQRLDQKEMESKVPGSIDTSMPAFVPSKPGKDRRVVFTAMALFFGLGLGGGAAFLRASRDQVIYAPRDMPQTMQAPFLGYVPLIPTRRLLGGALSDEFEQYQLSLIESVRVIRTVLLSRMNGKTCTSVLITSATTGTGKSSFTVILGKSLAQAGRNVLLIDVDFHKRTLSKRFDLLDNPGVIDAMTGRSVEKEHISPTETPGLSVLPVGRRTEGNVVFEEIANGPFKACMGQLNEQYDIILLDAPPMLAVADSVIIAAQVDGTIMVEREHVSQRAEVADALARLNSGGGHLMGTVFVGSVEERDYGYKHGYHYTRGRKS